jgi:hypothetical protein
VMVVGMAAVIGTPFLLHRGSRQDPSRDTGTRRTPQEGRTPQEVGAA